MGEEPNDMKCIVCGAPAEMRAHFNMCDKDYAETLKKLPTDIAEDVHFEGAKVAFGELVLDKPDENMSITEAVDKIESYAAATRLTWAVLRRISRAFTSFPPPLKVEGKDPLDKELWQCAVDSFDEVMLLATAAGVMREFDDVMAFVALAAGALANSPDQNMRVLGINLVIRIERFCRSQGECPAADEVMKGQG